MDQFNQICRITAKNIRNIPYHTSNDLRVIYILHGSITLEFIAGRYTLAEGQVEIINIYEPVQITGQGDNAVLFFDINGDLAKENCYMIDKGIFNCNTVLFYSSRADMKTQTEMKELLREIYTLYLEKDNENLRMSVVNMVKLIGEKCHDMRNMFSETDEQNIFLERFFRIYTYVYTHSTEKISLKQLAEQEYVSVPYLSRGFRNKLQRTFHGTLAYFRVIHAVKLLINTDLPVTEIAEQSGFSALRYLNKYMKEYMGSTPSAFRQKLRKTPKVETELPAESERVRNVLFGLGKNIDLQDIELRMAPEENLRIFWEKNSQYMVDRSGTAAEKCMPHYIDTVISKIGCAAKYIAFRESEKKKGKLELYMVKGGKKDSPAALAEAGAAAAALDRYMAKVGGACSFQAVLKPGAFSRERKQDENGGILLASVSLLFSEAQEKDR